MLDQFKRRINYLRISVTDRCNLRCEYCMPAEGIKLLNHNDILSLEEMAEVARIGVENGIDKIRITGGEPLVKRGIIDFVKMLSKLEGLKDLGLTTNGILLSKFADDLKSAGLHRVNISLDTLDPEKYKKITRGGDIHKVLDGIQAAKKAGLYPIKINCVIHKSRTEEDAQAVQKFCDQEGLQIRFIHQMNLNAGEFSVVEGGEGGNCKTCNRLRLTANGKLKPCLFSDLEFDIKEHGIEGAYRLALQEKPCCGSVNTVGNFYNIGG